MKLTEKQIKDRENLYEDFISDCPDNGTMDQLAQKSLSQALDPYELSSLLVGALVYGFDKGSLGISTTEVSGTITDR